MLGVPKEPVPVASYVAGDMAPLRIPFRLWMVAVAAFVLATFMAGFNPLLGIIVASGLLLFFRRAYAKDRHVVGVWRAKIIGHWHADSPLQPGWRPEGTTGTRKRIIA